ncbi:cation/H(+) antiporter 15-like [Papaver somniferum]|uniref:cation/H(+) antiporter 15-like n=1 Tax=Papaver somniferum TaxID=3469 RepID=UPI000E6FB086|nr:cation/H(+) antiporter 15-like [Papaver somniferum]
MEAANASMLVPHITGLTAGDDKFCLAIDRITSYGYLFRNGHNPLSYSFTLLILQLSVAPFIILVTHHILHKAIGTPLMISQIIGGIILGPSVLGHIHNFGETMFPMRSIIVLDIIATMGTIYFHFLIGLQMDACMILKAGRRELLIGISCVVVPILLSMASSVIVNNYSNVEFNVRSSLFFVGGAESMVAFPVIASVLAELKLLNTGFGRIALSSTMISGLISFSVISFILIIKTSVIETISMLQKIIAGGALLALVVFIRRLVMWKIKKVPDAQAVHRELLSFITLSVLVTALLSKYAGQNVIIGPFLLGMALPAGPPIGSELVKRLDFFVTWIIMPFFFVMHGLEMDLSTLRLQNVVAVEAVILVSVFGRFSAVTLASLYCNMGAKDALSVGLTVNVQGAIELYMFKMLRDIEIIDNNSFLIMSLSTVIVTGAVTPIIKFVYNSKKYSIQKRTIQHLAPNTELRMLVCIQNQDNVPAAIHLLKASNPARNSQIRVYLIHLVELVGRATPLFIAHKKSQRPPSSTQGLSGRIVNVFNRYEENNIETISVKSYTAVSPFDAMHIDVCTMALNKKTCIIIIPFHKQLDSTTKLFTPNVGFKAVNKEIINKAPCSVGIILDRGLLGGFRFVFASWLSYHVSMLFIGGADDREALAYSARMSQHPSISFTMVRVVMSKDIPDYFDERLLDDEAVDDTRQSMSGNDQFIYMEEFVKDRSGFLSLIQSMSNEYQLLMVGRNQDPNLLCRIGIGEWNNDEPTELGIIGDMIASDIEGKATLLVVQQQRLKRQRKDEKSM